ncbi:MAG: arsenate reductase ArsC [Gemmatimonadetes bacterium]|nr:arsenate reductase ArsC [Gemmatimonadota bacterium]
MTGHASAGSPERGDETPKSGARVLFICVENANRSQMAEAFARMHGGDAVISASAGSRPSGTVNMKAIEAMVERGYDLSVHESKSVDEMRGCAWDRVVTMGCGDVCPWVPAERREDWALPDPRDLDAAGVRAVRDEIERRVIILLAEMGITTQGRGQ